MRSARRGLDVPIVAPDLAQPGLRLDAVSDVLAGGGVQAGHDLARWWRHNHPEYGWLALGLLVAAADYTGSRTMSDVFRTASRHPVSGPCVAIGWGVLTAHLFGFIPPAYDPINLMWRKCHGQG
jgi:hypothetical protein